MSNISYWESADSLTFKSDEGIDFVSPATQDALRSWNVGGWEPTWESRADIVPMWERPDIFRTINYQTTRNIVFNTPNIKAPAAQVLPSGLLSFQEIQRTSPLVYSDHVKYHYNVQKVFSLLVQFDTLLESQISTFTSLPSEEVTRVMNILWGLQIVEKPETGWVYENTHGRLWRLIRYSPYTHSYVEGMDALFKLFAFGDSDLREIPPGGSGSRSTVKHNLFSAEVMLRILEGSDNIIGAWGDQFGAEHLFHRQNPNAEQRNSHADGILVTNNGSIIILEIVGAVSRKRGALKTLIDKTASWVGVIANSHLDINVLFVDTSFGSDSAHVLNAIDIGIRKESPRFAPDNFLRERALPHIGVIGGALWFPEDGCISQAGTRLMGYNVYNHNYSYFDEPDPKFSDSESRKNVMINTISALHNPSWIFNDFKERDFSNE